MSDALTIIHARGKRLAKLVRGDGTIDGYDSVKRVDLHHRDVSGLDALHDLLRKVSARPDCCVVRGQIIDPANAKGVRRLSRPDPETGDAPTLRDAPRRWVALDLDGLPLPPDQDPRDLPACVEAVLPLLPAEFRAVDCIVQATASHAIKPGARIRLWYWLNRGMLEPELKWWLRSAPVDRAVFRAAQPIYVAAPIFTAGAVDPLVDRIVTLRRRDRVVAAPLPEALRPQPRRPAMPRRQTDDTRARRYGLTALARAGARISRGDGGRHMVALSEALSLARLIRHGAVTRDEVVRVIDGALQVPGRHTASNEAEDLVEWAMAHAQERPVLEDDR